MKRACMGTGRKAQPGAACSVPHPPPARDIVGDFAASLPAAAGGALNRGWRCPSLPRRTWAGQAWRRATSRLGTALAPNHAGARAPFPHTHIVTLRTPTLHLLEQLVKVLHLRIVLLSVRPPAVVPACQKYGLLPRLPAAAGTCVVLVVAAAFRSCAAAAAAAALLCGAVVVCMHGICRLWM